MSTIDQPSGPYPPRIPKGLTMGHDNFASVSPEAMFNKWKTQPNCKRLLDHQSQRTLSQEEFEQVLWKHCHERFTNIKVRGAHPKSTDESVHYTVIPESPCGKITIRWWNQFDWGYCFDFVDVEQRKVVAPPSDLIIKLQVEDSSWIYIRSIEDAHERTCKSSNTRVNYKINANSGGTRRRAHVLFCIRGSAIPFAVVYAPQHNEFEEHNVPEYRLVKPE